MKLRNKIVAMLLMSVCLLAVSACKTDSGKGDKGEEAYFFVFQNTEIRVGESAAPVLTALQSQNPQCSVKPSCLAGASGEDVTYVFPGFQMQTFRLTERDGDEQIRIVMLNDDSVSTREGISIGAAVQAVKDAYGSASEETAYRIVYEKEGMKLVFSLRDGTVTNISYEAKD